jgi:hypothetical protein
MTTADRDFTVVRRRPHLVDITTPKRAGVQGYRLKAAANFDLTFQTILTADIGSGFLDPTALRSGSINRLTLGTMPGNHVRITFDPSTFAGPHPAGLDDNQHIWLQFFPVDFAGVEGTGGARALVLPDDEMSAQGRVIIRGNAPSGASVANSMRLDLPYRMRNMTIRNNAEDAAAATGTLTFTGLPNDTETVTIDGKVYTFQTVLTNVDGHVLIGATAAASLNNLIAAITLGAGAGSVYAALTTLHPSVTAAAGGGTTMVATAKIPGTSGNAITTTTTVTGATWSAPTLLGGTDGGGGTMLYVASTEGGSEITVAPQETIEFFEGNMFALLVRGDGVPVNFTATMTHYLPL